MSIRSGKASRVGVRTTRVRGRHRPLRNDRRCSMNLRWKSARPAGRGARVVRMSVPTRTETEGVNVRPNPAQSSRGAARVWPDLSRAPPTSEHQLKWPECAVAPEFGIGFLWSRTYARERGVCALFPGRTFARPRPLAPNSYVRDQRIYGQTGPVNLWGDGGHPDLCAMVVIVL